MEARVGIEPTIEDLQSSALPLGDRALNSMRQVEAGRDEDQVKFRILLSFTNLLLLHQLFASLATPPLLSLLQDA